MVNFSFWFRGSEVYQNSESLKVLGDEEDAVKGFRLKASIPISCFTLRSERLGVSEEKVRLLN